MSVAGNALASLADEARLLVVVGPGGVGKTTSAAAIAVACAKEGRRTLVLTADPARRLADALGMSGDGVPDPSLPLQASMLESERTFAMLLPRMVPDPIARARIEASPVYQRFSRSLARSHAYAAIERLHSVLFGDEAKSFDLVVLDTPPMRGVLDLLDAPEALGQFAGSRAVDVFAGAQDSFFGWAARRALGVLTGPVLGAGLTEFLAAFAPFRAGFAERAAGVAKAQRDSSSRVVLVTSGQDTRIADARALATALHERDVSCHALLASAVLRRSEPAWALAQIPAGIHDLAVCAAFASGERARASESADLLRLSRFRNELATRSGSQNPLPLLATPRTREEPCGVDDLFRLSAGARWLGA